MNTPMLTPAPAKASRRVRRQQRVHALRRIKARLRHAALTRAPLWLSRGLLCNSRSVQRIHMTERTVVMPELPDALDGLRIAHLSDLHVGELTRPERLPDIIDSVNRLNADLIAVTGDLVDLSLKVLDRVLVEIGRLHAPLGVHLVAGNHDYLENQAKFLSAVQQSGLGLLINQARVITAHGCHIRIGGIDYAAEPRDLRRLVRRTMRTNGATQGLDLQILLAHHPDAFEEASRLGVDLTLSGHTHGGQFKLSTRRGRKGSIGLGSMAFRYPHGLYQRGSSHLHVTAGIGLWFPLRLRCPAEIVTLKLKSQADPVVQLSHP